MTDSQLHSLARIGAESRRRELLTELADLDAYLTLTTNAPDGQPDTQRPRRTRLTGRPDAGNEGNGAVSKRRTMSAEGRARISAAQRARWAKLRKGK